MLRNVQIGKSFLQATTAELLDNFYRPALRESSLYQRGTAFFSVEFLLNLMDSLVEFVCKGGLIHLVTSVELDEKTIQTFTNGYLLSEEEIESALQEKLTRYLNETKTHTPDEEVRLDVLANMIAARHLIIKVGTTSNGIYHEKIGVFTDAVGDSIAFMGSANETLNAFYNNYETVTIGTSWGKGSDLAAEYKEHFHRVWTNEEKGVQVIDFPSALEQRIIGAFKKSPTLDEAIRRLMQQRHLLPENPAKHTLHDFQSDAVEEFVKNGYLHLFEMATGTGKTFTAVKAIERMTHDKKYLNVVVLVPLVDLQRQWERAINEDLDVDHRIFKFGGEGKDLPRSFRMSTLTAATSHQEFVSISICVYDTFFSGLYKELNPMKGDLLTVVDEAHNLTVEDMELTRSFSVYRLGLSATPTRYSKKETEKLLSVFLEGDKQSFKYTLKQAIDADFLSHYEYHPIEVELTDEENEKYAAASKKIATLYSIYQADRTALNRQNLEKALRDRSLIVKKAENKLSMLWSMVASKEYDFHNSVIFCGPGKVMSGAKSGEKIIDVVTEALGCNPAKHYFPAKYTSSEADRPARLEGFREGLTDALVAVKCFDEGLDVPALDKIYIMASDSSLRQTIQRRGRVLRISRDTGKTIAHIYDMVAGQVIGKTFFALPTELPRVYEYASISNNPEASVSILGGYTPNGDNGFDNLDEE